MAYPRSPRGASTKTGACAGWILSKHKADQGGPRGFPGLETEQRSLGQGTRRVHDNWPGGDSVRTTGVTSSQDVQARPGKATVRLAHLVPHLVVHGDALPVLKVAAVRAGRSRACPRRHRAEPRSLTPTLCLPTQPSTQRTPFLPLRPGLRLALYGVELRGNFRSLYPGRTDSVVSSSRMRSWPFCCSFSQRRTIAELTVPRNGLRACPAMPLCRTEPQATNTDQPSPPANPF